MGERADTRGWGPGWPNCQTKNLVTVVLSTGVRLPVRREIAELVKLLCEAVIARGFIIRAGASWGFACRAIRGSTAPSNHSWGLALDLNAPDHPLGKRNTGMPAYVVELFKRYGWRWGGDYVGRADEMHFEFMGTPADAAADTARARTDLATAGHQGVPVPEEDDMNARAVYSHDGHYWVTNFIDTKQITGSIEFNYLINPGGTPRAEDLKEVHPDWHKSLIDKTPAVV